MKEQHEEDSTQQYYFQKIKHQLHVMKNSLIIKSGIKELLTKLKKEKKVTIIINDFLTLKSLYY